MAYADRERREKALLWLESLPCPTSATAEAVPPRSSTTSPSPICHLAGDSSAWTALAAALAAAMDAAQAAASAAARAVAVCNAPPRVTPAAVTTTTTAISSATSSRLTTTPLSGLPAAASATTAAPTTSTAALTTTALVPTRCSTDCLSSGLTSVTAPLSGPRAAVITTTATSIATADRIIATPPSGPPAVVTTATVSRVITAPPSNLRAVIDFPSAVAPSYVQALMLLPSNCSTECPSHTVVQMGPPKVMSTVPAAAATMAAMTPTNCSTEYLSSPTHLAQAKSATKIMESSPPTTLVMPVISAHTSTNINTTPTVGVDAHESICIPKSAALKATVTVVPIQSMVTSAFIEECLDKDSPERNMSFVVPLSLFSISPVCQVLVVGFLLAEIRPPWPPPMVCSSTVITQMDRCSTEKEIPQPDVSPPPSAVDCLYPRVNTCTRSVRSHLRASSPVQKVFNSMVNKDTREQHNDKYADLILPWNPGIQSIASSVYMLLVIYENYLPTLELCKEKPGGVSTTGSDASKPTVILDLYSDGACTLWGKMSCRNSLMQKQYLKLEYHPLIGREKELFSARKVFWCHVSFTKWLNQFSQEKEEILSRGIVDLSLLGASAIVLLGASAIVDDENQTSRKEKSLFLHWKFRELSLFEFDLSDQSERLPCLVVIQRRKYVITVTFFHQLRSGGFFFFPHDCSTTTKLMIPWDPGESEILMQFTAMILVGTVGQIISELFSSTVITEMARCSTEKKIPQSDISPTPSAIDCLYPLVNICTRSVSSNLRASSPVQSIVSFELLEQEQVFLEKFLEWSLSVVISQQVKWCSLILLYWTQTTLQWDPGILQATHGCTGGNNLPALNLAQIPCWTDHPPKFLELLLRKGPEQKIVSSHMLMSLVSASLYLWTVSIDPILPYVEHNSKINGSSAGGNSNFCCKHLVPKEPLVENLLVNWSCNLLLYLEAFIIGIVEPRFQIMSSCQANAIATLTVLKLHCTHNQRQFKLQLLDIMCWIPTVWLLSYMPP